MGSPAPEMATSTTEEQRLRSLLLSLQTESAILERIVYKNKNQHRRCPYFQALLKVRRDVRLLQSAALGEILHTLLPIIDGKKPAASAYQAMRLKRKQPSGKHNYQERLLGVARLLSQMAEPILEAAIQISFLLAKSFFTGFSTTILALLARLRVLVQQILLDVVSVFNKVSSLSQKKQSVKLIEEGIEAFREYYPMSGEADRAVTLECLWEEDKFVLIERANNNNVKPSDVDQEALPLEAPIQYETVDLFNEVQSDDGDFSSKKTQNDLTARDLHLIAREPSINSSTAVSETHGIGVKLTTRTEDGEKKLASASEKSASVGSDSRKKRVAFVSVAKPKTSDANTDCSNKKMKSDSLINDATETVSVAKPKTSDANTDWSNKKMKSDSLINDATETDDPFLSLLLGGRENNNSVF